MKLAALKTKLKYNSFFIPFTGLSALLLALLLFAYKWLIKNNALPDSSYTAIITLFIKVVIAFAGGIFLFGFVSAVIPWLIFILNKKNKNVQIKIKTDSQNTTFSEKQKIHIYIKPLRRPLSGFIDMRIEFDEVGMSHKLHLVNNRRNLSFFNDTINADVYWELPQIKEYNVHAAIVYFEDMFRLFSFAVGIPVSNSFYTQPLNSETDFINVQPNKTNDTQIRIEKIRKVSGELLSYKNFEDQDDVRRIVWKIYAKNGELVVRIPETNDPYASHAYVYASFYNGVFSDVNADLNALFLNHYKTAVWNIYRQLSKQELQLHYIPDQQTPALLADDQIEKVKFSLVTSDWQKSNPLMNYYKDDASVICISSFTNAADVELMIEKSSKNLLVVFVKHSNIFSGASLKNWLQWVFIEPKAQTVDKSRLLWNVSPLKKMVSDNEKQIEAALNKSDVEKLII
ncbi:hypothetical protein BH09BAC2_BH09BAC2_09380 [soil metagenome]